MMSRRRREKRGAGGSAAERSARKADSGTGGPDSECTTTVGTRTTLGTPIAQVPVALLITQKLRGTTSSAGLHALAIAHRIRGQRSHVFISDDGSAAATCAARATRAARASLRVSIRPDFIPRAKLWRIFRVGHTRDCPLMGTATSRATAAVDRHCGCAWASASARAERSSFGFTGRSCCVPWT